MTLKLRSAAVTDCGLVRSANQDSVHAGEWLVAVADGMGGMAAGDLASAIAIEAIAGLDVALGDEQLAEALREAVATASERIRAAVTEDPTREGMGTTLTALLCSATGTAVALVHVGDSRAYLLRGGVLEQMTKDDTFVQMLVDEGVITAEQAMTHPRRAVVTRALQGEPVTAAYGSMAPYPGDRWLLCSDGLSNVVPADVIGEVLTGYPDPQACARRLVELALDGGGPDNVTVVIADIVEGA
ncbi:protein phosphatase [Micromonospora pattaloongensis]|uniref:Protein phosphatase n=1 Tax=Micromonospora pattaloongensis TaxID=405436 RepID=A0A1H3JBD1_9ACTN|nr:protein phosphatase 2C domain-containing protein [Micromonospora pattaloongensis]SDY36524.1 protein phosphatase [Micromonospora pattaloongensis]